MEGKKNRVLIVCGRILVAQGLVSLLEDAPQVAQIEVSGNLHDGMMRAAVNPPDVIIIDMPFGEDFHFERPVRIGDRDIKTIVMLEGERGEPPRLYVHLPGRTSNLRNLMNAILLQEPPEEAQQRGEVAHTENYVRPRAKIGPTPPVVPAIPQPTSRMRASASEPSKSRNSSSSREL